MLNVRIRILGSLRLEAGSDSTLQRLARPTSPLSELILGVTGWSQGPVGHRELIEMLWDKGDWDAVWEGGSHPEEDERRRCKKCIDGHVGQLSARVSEAREPFWQVMSRADARELLHTHRKRRGARGPAGGRLGLSREFEGLQVDADRFIELAEQPSRESKLEALRLIEGPLLAGIEAGLPADVDDSWLWEARAEQRVMVEGLVAEVLGGEELVVAVSNQIYEAGDHSALAPGAELGGPGAAFDISAFRAPLQSRNLDLLQDCAGDTFKDLVRIWTDESDAFEQPLDDYRRLRLESWWGGVGGLEMTWRIEAAIAPQQVFSEALDCDCLEWVPDAHILEQLRLLRAEPGPLLLAIAVPQNPELEPVEIRAAPAEERFHWYAVDLGQFLDHPAAGERPGSILIPYANRFELSLFSLLWGAHWVKSFFEPLNHPGIAAIPALNDFVANVYSMSLAPEPSITAMGWNFLDKVLPSYASDFDAEKFAEISFRLGLGAVLHLIRGQLDEDLSRLTDIRNYCPEALYGTINLWLFARGYHFFMEQTAVVATSQAPIFTNQRFLPLGAPSVEETPRMLRTAAWNVMLCYRQLFADVRLVQRPAKGAGDDHSYYGGGGIGYFPWMKVGAAGADWMIEAEDRGSKTEHQDFLDEQAAEDRTIIAVSDSAASAAKTLKIVPKRLNPPTRCPVLLFPPEDRFLAYPRWLWGPGALAALDPQGR